MLPNRSQLTVALFISARDPQVANEREAKLRELAAQPNVTDRLVKAIGKLCPRCPDTRWSRVRSRPLTLCLCPCDSAKHLWL